MEEGVGRTGQGCVIVFSISSRADWGPPGGALVRPLHPGREQSREPIFLPLLDKRPFPSEKAAAERPFAGAFITQRSSRKLRVASCSPRVLGGFLA